MPNQFISLLVIIALAVSCKSEKTSTDANLSSSNTTKRNAVWATDQPYVVLVSIDGFRHDYVEMFGAKNLTEMRSTGASAKKMYPSFPSKTFPNHYTIVTGQYPANHGLVSNSFYSRSKKDSYSIGKKSAVTDGNWYGGVPLWSLAEENEMLSASYFWVGSEAKIANHRPTYSYPYDGSTPNADRVNQVIDWLQLPIENRPHLITLYFSIVDDFGHRYGPEAEKMKTAVMEIDSLIGVLRNSIAQSEESVYLAITSDHGMSEISRGVVLSDYVDLGDNKVYYSTPTMIYTTSDEEKERLVAVLDTVKYFDTYTQDKLPEKWRYQNDDRLGDIILINHAPTVILSAPTLVSGGTHGFDPLTNEDMATIFFIEGPQIKQGYEIAPFQNIHIYPLIAKILGLEYSHEIDGSLDILLPVLKK